MDHDGKKHWTEPNGIFIVNIPIEWQYRNVAIKGVQETSPYSFEPYENSVGCLQLSCYPLNERGPNKSQPIQSSNSKIEWLLSRMDNDEFDMYVFHAQVDDQLCMAKYIYSAKHRKNKEIEAQLGLVQLALDSLRVIPISDRSLAANLAKYDNFLGSLIASHDLLYKAMESESYIELVVLLANQIDAFLRLSIVLKMQLVRETNDIEMKYLFQGVAEKGISERSIYDKALELGIINNEIFTKLDELYALRNRVIHRYIISFLKTRDIVEIVVGYFEVSDKVMLMLRSYEDAQIGRNFGIYGNGFIRHEVKDESDFRRAYAMVNDKHLLGKLMRKL